MAGKRGRGRKVTKPVSSKTDDKRKEVTGGATENENTGDHENGDHEDKLETKAEEIEVLNKRGRPKRGVNKGTKNQLDSKPETAEEARKKLKKEARIVIEHCKSCQVYKRNALALKEALHAAYPDIEVDINPEKPRRNSFECLFVGEDDRVVVLWSGISRGPPRKLKFPSEQSQIIDALKGAL